MARTVTHETSDSAATRTVGQSNPARDALYEDIAGFLTGKLGTAVHVVKPKTHKGVPNKNGTGDKVTGGYGLAFEFEGQIANLEIVLKRGTLDDFTIVE